MKTLRVGQINILNKRLENRYQLIAEAVEINQVEILFLQEVVDVELIQEKLRIAGLTYFAQSDEVVQGQYCLIASKYPVSEINLKNTFNTKLTRGIAACQIQYDDYTINAFSGHFTWGSENEEIRLKQAEIVEKAAKSLEKPNEKIFSLFGGDTNAEPNSRTMRYFTGKDLSINNTSTLWVDAYDMHGDESNYMTTDHATNPYGILTAQGVGITRTELLPKRRIDYILLRGWIYGKSGCPVNFSYLKHPGNHVLSDHEGIMSDLLVL